MFSNKTKAHFYSAVANIAYKLCAAFHAVDDWAHDKLLALYEQDLADHDRLEQEWLRDEEAHEAKLEGWSKV